MPQESGTICRKCVGDRFLKDRLRLEGAIGSCRFCRSRTNCVSVKTLAEWVGRILDEHFRESPSSSSDEDDDFSYCRQEGHHLDSIVDEMIKPKQEDVVTAVLHELAALSHSKIKYGRQAHYNRKANYVKTKVSIHDVVQEWVQFQHELEHRSRFFSARAKGFLDGLMRDVDSLCAGGLLETPVIHMLSKSVKLYRARPVDPTNTVWQILKAPQQELGPPPPGQARAGRMNAQGISVFYGAFDRETCVAEVRPSIGSRVVSAEFRLRKPVRILDFGLLEKCYHKHPLSYFQPDFKERATYRRLLTHLHSIIRQPVLPGCEREYIATQALAEYLATIGPPPVDGVSFSSVQRKGNGGHNIVLFGHVLDIQLTVDHKPTMGPNSALVLCDESVRVHRIEGINYEFDYSILKGGKLKRLGSPRRISQG